MDELHKQAKATLGIAQNLRSAVKLPPGEDLNEWLAVHVSSLLLNNIFICLFSWAGAWARGLSAEFLETV
jgi:Mob1/phocein family